MPTFNTLVEYKLLASCVSVILEVIAVCMSVQTNIVLDVFAFNELDGSCDILIVAIFVLTY